MRTRRASSSRAPVGQLIARHSMPTAYATSGRVCVEQYRRAPTRDMYWRWMSGSTLRSALVRSAASTCLGRSS
eukprot:810226-Pleurochrysis_carterae.AAC.1